jgi:hypothetical protein
MLNYQLNILLILSSYRYIANANFYTNKFCPVEKINYCHLAKIFEGLDFFYERR